MNSAFINSIKDYGNHVNASIRLNFSQNVHMIVGLIDRPRFELIMDLIVRLITTDSEMPVRTNLASNLLPLSENIKAKDV